MSAGHAADSVAALRSGSTPKRRELGTLRSRTPAETLERITPHLPGCGITRVANVTGLDRIGIPVFMVVRPNARSLSVAQGKGRDAIAARVSGIMEAVESYHAERARCPLRLECYAELALHEQVADPAALPLALGGAFTEHHQIPWALGVDVLRQAEVWVPFEMVHANATLPLLPGSGCFLRGTNGLASGNTLGEAVVHGLCEVIERDAMTLWERRPGAWMRTSRLELDTVDDPVCRELLELYQRADVAVMAWDMTTDVGVAAFRAVIFDRTAEAALKPWPATMGAGCHPERGVALSRALLEAAQSRLTLIAGSRDDLSRRRYARVQSAQALHLHRRLAEQPGEVDFRAVPTANLATVEEDLEALLGRLAGAGIGQVLVVDLSRESFPVAVARVIVPGLEAPMETPGWQPGPRARALAG